jgi:hypothetical protein
MCLFLRYYSTDVSLLCCEYFVNLFPVEFSSTDSLSTFVFFSSGFPLFLVACTTVPVKVAISLFNVIFKNSTNKCRVV